MGAPDGKVVKCQFQFRVKYGQKSKGLSLKINVSLKTPFIKILKDAYNIDNMRAAVADEGAGGKGGARYQHGGVILRSGTRTGDDVIDPVVINMSGMSAAERERADEDDDGAWALGERGACGKKAGGRRRKYTRKRKQKRRRKRKSIRRRVKKRKKSRKRRIKRRRTRRR